MIIVIIIIIVFAISHKKSSEEIINSNLLVSENLTENKDLENQNEENIVKKIKVYVTGEVNRPGVVELNEGARIEDAINLSGGMTENADISKINLAYMLEDGQKIYIPNINENVVNEYITKENEVGVIEEKTSSKKININTDNINELMSLPGVGESLAQKIINYKSENGKFKSIEDLKNVSGIGEKKFENIKQYITVK